MTYAITYQNPAFQGDLKDAIAKAFQDLRKQVAEGLRLPKPLLMALGLADTLRNAMLDEFTTAVDAGAGAGLLRIYDGTRPAKGGTATTLLAELTFSDPSFPAASSGAMSANTITADSSANATGTATWFRVVTSVAGFVCDGDVGLSGSDLNLDNTSITTGQQVSCSQFDLTGPNA